MFVTFPVIISFIVAFLVLLSLILTLGNSSWYVDFYILQDVFFSDFHYSEFNWVKHILQVVGKSFLYYLQRFLSVGVPVLVALTFLLLSIMHNQLLGIIGLFALFSFLLFFLFILSSISFLIIFFLIIFSVAKILFLWLLFIFIVTCVANRAVFC